MTVGQTLSSNKSESAVISNSTGDVNGRDRILTHDFCTAGHFLSEGSYGRQIDAIQTTWSTVLLAQDFA